jgi:hypothetical protein
LTLDDKPTKYKVYKSRRLFGTLLSAVIILALAWSVLISGFPPGMEPSAALFLITPFAMFIILAQILEYMSVYRKL